MDQEEQSKCVHHWILSKSARGRVHAKCKKCGLERVFTNTKKALGIPPSATVKGSF